jgi:hypothetical protein
MEIPGKIIDSQMVPRKETLAAKTKAREESHEKASDQCCG